MAHLSNSEIQQRYRKNKTEHGYKRTQFWTLDENNPRIKEQVIQAAKSINDKEESAVMDWVEQARKDVFSDWK